MSTISYRQLAAAGAAGGASAVSLVTELMPAGGLHAGIAPPRSEPGPGSAVFGQVRYIDGEPVAVVVIDDKRRQLKRVEAAIEQSIVDEHPLLSRVPRIRVSLGGGRVCHTDLQLPHRAFDALILAGTIDGTPVQVHPDYRAARQCSPADARAMLELSPGSLVFGAHDPTGDGGRFRGALAGEIVGVLAEQQQTSARGPRQTGLVGCRRIIRTQVLSFAALRQLRFDAGPVGDAACRALLAAYALAGLVRANAELAIRADCDLVESKPTAMRLDARDGAFVMLEAPTLADCDALLEQALEAARLEADIVWRGQMLEVTGDPDYRSKIDADAAGGAATPARPFWRQQPAAARRN